MSLLNEYNPSKEESFIHSLIIGVLIALIVWICSKHFPSTIATASFCFALWSKFADNKKIDAIELKLQEYQDNLSKKRKLIHGEYALKKIIYLRTILSKSVVNKSAVPYALYELENILNQMYRCCSVGDEKESFKQIKGIIGNFKTQIEITSPSDNLRDKYIKFIEKLQEAQVFIQEL